jgi:hypothetical protein
MILQFHSARRIKAKQSKLFLLHVVQVGIDRFDFGYRKAIGTRLNVGDPHCTNRIWEPHRRDKDREFKVEFY